MTSKPPFTLFVNVYNESYGDMVFTDRLDIAGTCWEGFVETVDETCHAQRDFQEMTDESSHQNLRETRHCETRGKVPGRLLFYIRVDVRSMRNARRRSPRGAFDKVLSL